MATSRFGFARRVAVAVAMSALALSAVGCTEKSPDDAPTTPEPSVEAVPVQPGGGASGSDGGGSEASPGTPDAEVAGAPSPEQEQAAADYLTVRENAESTMYPSPAEWEAAMRGVTTAEGFDSAMAASRPADSSPARSAATSGGYVVKVGLGGCTLNPAYEITDANVAIQCSLTDLVTTADGALVTNVATAWPYYGAQDGPLLSLTKVGDRWLVSADNTNSAG